MIFHLTLSQVLRRAYFYLITKYGGLSSAFAAICNCDLESSQGKHLPLPLFADLLRQHVLQEAFDVLVHNLIWASSSVEGATLEMFVAVMSRAPLLLPHQSCHTMRCILFLCKSNAISCAELFLLFSPSDDGFIRRTVYALQKKHSINCTLLLAWQSA